MVNDMSTSVSRPTTVVTELDAIALKPPEIARSMACALLWAPARSMR